MPLRSLRRVLMYKYSFLSDDSVTPNLLDFKYIFAILGEWRCKPGPMTDLDSDWGLLDLFIIGQLMHRLHRRCRCHEFVDTLTSCEVLKSKFTNSQSFKIWNLNYYFNIFNQQLTFLWTLWYLWTFCKLCWPVYHFRLGQNLKIIQKLAKRRFVARQSDKCN